VRIESKTRVQHASYDSSDAGEGLAVFFSQDGACEARYRCLVKAITTGGTFDMGEFYISPPTATQIPGRLSRMVAAAICPGAIGWAVDVSCIPSLIEDELVLPSETAEIILASSHCCGSPMGVHRVSERYKSFTGVSAGGSDTFTVLAGMKITGIAALGLTGSGSVSYSDLTGTITVPEGLSVNLAPEGSLSPNCVITLNNVDYVIEYLESA